MKNYISKKPLQAQVLPTERLKRSPLEERIYLISFYQKIISLSSVFCYANIGKRDFIMQKIQQQVFDFLKDMGRGTILAVSADLMPFSNDSFDNARFMSQLLFLAEGREDEFIPITFNDWKDAKLSRYAVEKARHFFYSMGVLEYKVKKFNGNPTAHYKIDFKLFMEKLKSFFKKVGTVIFSSYAESLKRKREQEQTEMRTTPKPLLNKVLESKNIGQVAKRESRQERKDKYEKFYL